MPRSRTPKTPVPIDCEHVGLDYFATAPCRIVVRETIRATPEQIFDVFLDADSWSRWAFPIQAVEWTSPFPLEVGSTRTVFMTAGMTGWEEFIAWEPCTRMAFRFNQSVEGGPDAFAEDYRLSDAGGGRTHLEWTMAMTLPGLSGRLTPLLQRLMWPANRLMLRRFRRYVEANVGA
ncbi:MAG: SRPBCC family protein [Acidimicrobiales bacterium]